MQEIYRKDWKEKRIFDIKIESNKVIIEMSWCIKVRLKVKGLFARGNRNDWKGIKIWETDKGFAPW